MYRVVPTARQRLHILHEESRFFDLERTGPVEHNIKRVVHVRGGRLGVIESDQPHP
jgi:hypothetical protein